MASRFKVWVCGHLRAEILGLYPAGCMLVSVSFVSCQLEVSAAS